MHLRSQSKVKNPIQTPHGETVYELLGRAVGPGEMDHSIAVVEIEPGRASLRHYHPETRESYYVQAGSGRMELGAETQEVSAGDLIFIPPGETHKITNLGAGTLQLWVVCVPAWTPDCSVFTEIWDAEKSRCVPAEPYTVTP